MGLAAMAAILHLAVLAARVSARCPHARPIIHAIAVCDSGPMTTHVDPDNKPSHPMQTYCVGQIALNVGMAVVALALWLHIMRMSSAHAN